MGYSSNKETRAAVVPMSMGIHKGVKLVKAGYEKLESKDPTKGGYETLVYKFKNPKGEIFDLRIFNPENGTDPERIAKGQERAANTAVYVAEELLGKNDVELNGENINSFEDFANEATKLLGEDYNKVDLQLKIVGSVYKGKTNLGVPYQFTWLARVDSKKVIKITDLEKTGCAEYTQAITNPKGAVKSDSSDMGDITIDDDMPF
jgi:hypothetical protein